MFPPNPSLCVSLILIGSTIRSFAERSGATVQINEKGDAEETNERVLVIAGEPCASIIIRPDFIMALQ